MKFDRSGTRELTPVLSGSASDWRAHRHDGIGQPLNFCQSFRPLRNSPLAKLAFVQLDNRAVSWNYAAVVRTAHFARPQRVQPDVSADRSAELRTHARR